MPDTHINSPAGWCPFLGALVRIRNWEKFQHYKNRRPPWIKLYREIIDDPDFHELPGDDFKILVMLWLIAAEDPLFEGNLPSNRKVAFRLRMEERDIPSIYARLSHFIEGDDSKVISGCYQDASKVLARCYQDATPEGEGETETQLDNSNELSPHVTTLNYPDPSNPLLAIPVPTNKPKPKTKTKRKTRTTKSGPVWESYAAAYLRRYGTEPVRNAKSNALCCQLVDRLGAAEAPLVADYYPSSNNGYYAARGHTLSCLVADAEKIRTEWATGKTIYQREAHEQDRLGATGEMWREIMEENELKEKIKVEVTSGK